MYGVQYVNEYDELTGIDIFNSDHRLIKMYRNSLHNENCTPLNHKLTGNNPDDFLASIEGWIRYNNLHLIKI